MKAKRETSADILRGIACDLKAGHEFGYHSKVLGHFEHVLWCDYGGGRDRPERLLWFWSHYGRSANPANLKELAWLIREIFETTPCEFRKAYEMV